MGATHELSDDPQWVGSLRGYIKPYWDSLLSSSWAEGVANGRLSVSEMQGWMLQMFPVIHAFPKFLAEALIKVEDDYSRSFLIDNIRVEKAHAEHWLWMAIGFGVGKEEMLALAEGHRPVLRDVQSLTDWLWYINTKGALAEAVAATSFAVEGAIGELARKVMSGFESYRDRPGVDFGPRTYKWMKEHARYDDEHPKIALEIVKRYATNERTQTRVMLAAKRSIELIHQALQTSYLAYSPSLATTRRTEPCRRASDRRKHQQLTGFPERRFREWRGVVAPIAA